MRSSKDFFQNRSFRSHLLLMMIFPALLVFAVTGMLLYASVDHIDRERTENLSLQIVQARSQQMGTWIASRITEIREVSHAECFSAPFSQEARKHLQESCNQSFSSFETIFLSDMQGNAYTCDGGEISILDRPYFQQVLSGSEELVISNPVYSKVTGNLVMVLLLRLSANDGSTLGFLGGTVALSAFDPLLESMQISGKGYAWIMQQDGLVIAHPVPEVVMSVNTLQIPGVNQDYLDFFQRVTRTPFGIGEYQREGQPVQKMMFSAIPSSPGWILALTIFEPELYENSLLIRRLFWVLTISSLALFAFMALLTARVFSRPLEEAAKKLQDFSLEKPSFHLPERGPREMALLARRFNETATSLSYTIEQLTHSQQTIEASNEELAAMNEQLQASNQQLEASFLENEALSQDLEKILSLTSEMSLFSEGEENTFFQKMIGMLLGFVPRADTGAVGILDEKRWFQVVAVGQDLEAFNRLQLQRNQFRHPPELMIWKNPLVDARKVLDPEVFHILEDNLHHAKEIASAPLKVGENIVGSVTLTILHDHSSSFSREDLRVFRAFSNVTSAFLTTQQFRMAQEKFQKQLLLSMIKVLELYDPYTRGHSESVAEISRKLSRQLGMEEKEVHQVYWAGLVHDVGKILVPIDILGKPGKLSLEEFDVMKKHPEWGASVLSTGDELEEIVKGVRHHHENWDGTGYPDKIAREHIPLMARIISVADAYDAMTSDRPYRNALPEDIALSEIQKHRGTQFDPQVVDAFLSCPACRQKSTP
ncbi:MAG TPA: HD domain-containing protein [Thermotogota bacterium]|nr:HD domain-containing protein [Thermotogota bacterium]